MDKAKFFDACRKGVMGPTLDDNEVSGAGFILDAMQGDPIAHADIVAEMERKFGR